VAEIEDEEGPVVEQIEAHNPTNQPLFIPSGWIVGGKLSQLRTFDHSVVIDPFDTKNVEVSCVEQGRWEPADVPLDGGRAPLKVSASGWIFNETKGLWAIDGSTRQAAIWNQIQKYEKETGVRPTHSLEQIMREDSLQRTFPRTIQKLAGQHLRILNGQNGAVISFDGKPLFMEAFRDTNRIRSMLLQTIRGISFDIPHLRFKVTPAEKIQKFIDEVQYGELDEIPINLKSTELAGGTPDFDKKITLDRSGDKIHVSLINRNHSSKLLFH
jgi:hypothetical protein